MSKPGNEPKNKSQNQENQEKQNTEAQQLYLKRRDELFSEFSEKCKKEGIDLVIAAVIDPKIPDQPIVFVKGQTYPLTILSTDIARHFKKRLDSELSI